MKKTAIALAVALLTSVSATAQTTAAQGVPLTLADIERLALEHNPTAVAAQAVIDAARGRGRQAGAWPNPVVGVTADDLSLDDRQLAAAHGVFIGQTIPLGGKLGRSQAVFERAADTAVAGAAQQRQRILTSVRTIVYQVLSTERRIEVHERLSALSTEAVGVTAQLFNVGAADRPDFLETEIEARRIQLELRAARNHVFGLRQQLAAVAGTAEVATRPLAGSIEQSIPELEREAVMRTLLERSPQISAARAEIERAHAVVEFERRRAYPDLFLRAVVLRRELQAPSGRPFGLEGRVEAGLSVPLFNRNGAGVVAAQAEEARARAELTRLELSLRSAAAMSFSTYLTAVQATETYRNEILPRAEEAYRLYLDRYRAMAAAYPQVLVAQRTLFEMSSAYIDSVNQLWQSALVLQGMLAGDGLLSPSSD